MTFGALGDSFYEYLLKVWIQGGRREDTYRRMYDAAMDGVDELLVQKVGRVSCNGWTRNCQCVVERAHAVYKKALCVVAGWCGCFWMSLLLCHRCHRCHCCCRHHIKPSLSTHQTRGMTYLSEWNGSARQPQHRMDHLACFMAGNLALGSMTSQDPARAARDLKTGKART